MYKEAIEKNYKLPEKYEDFSFHSYNTQPLPTESLKPAEILRLRDNHYIEYHTNKNFLNKVEKKFGLKAKDNILNMSKIKLKRKIIEELEKNNY